MANVIKLRKGLDIHLAGKAELTLTPLPLPPEIGLLPSAFVGVTPKLTVREGDHVLAGQPLFANKACPEVGFASPVSGTVSAIVRGDRRKVLCVKVKTDADQQYADFGAKDVSKLSAADVTGALLQAGLFGYIGQLPYAVSTTPDTHPKAIFVSALRDMPLAADFGFELQGDEAAFQTGLTALAKVAPTYLGIGKDQTATEALAGATGVEVNIFDGPCPAGNVDVQVNHIAPVNKGEVVWTVDPTAVIFFGRLFLTGRVDLRRKVAVAGSRIAHPEYVQTVVGAPLSQLLDQRLTTRDHTRIIDGNPLTGRKASADDYLSAHTSEVTAIPEGDDVNEFLGWIAPRTSQFSVSRTYFSWLFGKHRTYDIDARVKGGERHMIMSGEYDRVLPMDIYAGYLVKAIISGDIDRQEALGIYEVGPDDFALAEFVDSSKLPLQQIVRQGLDILRKENA